MHEIDNRKGTNPIYFIISIAPDYGIVDVGRVSNNRFQFVEYTDKEDWLRDMELLGIKYTEEQPQ
jgi:hypothetical protein